MDRVYKRYIACVNTVETYIMGRRLLLNLSTDDHRLLRQVAEYLHVPRTHVLRWALRHYVLRGDWPATRETGRRTILGHVPRLDIGPKYEEVQ